MTEGERALIGIPSTDAMRKSKETFERRFWAKVQKGPGPKDCWLWTGARRQCHGKNALDSDYGQIRLGPRGSTPLYAHRASLALAGIEISDGMIPHHECGNSLCVRPDHLKPATQSYNTRRANQHIARRGEQTDLDERS